MAGRRSDSIVSARVGRASPIRLLGALCARAGVILGVPSLLVLLGSLTALLSESAPSSAARVLAVGADPAALSGAEFAFYAAALGLLASCWLLGLGLLIDGVFDE